MRPSAERLRIIKPGADHEHDRQRDLGRHQRAAQALPAPPTVAC